MSFVLKHNLTDAALQDLLNLIALLIPTPNICITSMYKFKNFFSSTQLDYARIYFCKKCKSAIDGMVQGQCRSCRDQLDLKSFFIKISISEQLKNLFGKHGFYTWLQHRFTRSTRSGHLSDVYDGELYQNLSKPGEFLSFKEHISFQWNTDGVPLFHSSSFSMWPLYLKINELPYKLLLQQQNLSWGVVWC